MDTTYSSYLKWRVKILTPSDPQTPQGFATLHKLTLANLQEFEAKPSFEEDLRKASLSWLQSKIPELLHVAYKEAKASKSVADIERLVDIAHRLKKKGEEGGNQFNFFNLNEGQHKRIAERYIRGRTASVSSGSGTV